MDVQKTLKQLEKDGIKFITLQFTDLLGVIKEVIKPVEEFEGAANNGVWFDGSKGSHEFRKAICF
jgi:glutamine synthetase